MYWHYKDKRFYNKLEGLKYAEAQSCSYDLKFSMFSAASDSDFLNEPVEDWQTVLRNYAQEIRDRYKYVRLWYSGGVDSQTILDTFVYNDIPIDEIVLLKRSPVDGFEISANDEIEYAAKPYLEYLKPLIEKTKITTVVHGQQLYRDIFINDDVFEKHQSGVQHFMPNDSISILRHNLSTLSVPGSCDVLGVEKPRVGKDERGYFCYNIDQTVLCFVHDTALEPADVIYFYQHPRVASKQAHMLKNYVKQSGDVALTDMHQYDKHLDTVNKVCRNTLFSKFSMGKGIAMPAGEKFISGMSIKDRMLLSQARTYDPQLYNAFWGKIDEFGQEVLNSVGKKWLNNQQDVFDNMVGIVSEKRYLEFF